MAGLIWLASYPKSGNTWLRAFIHNLMLNPDEPHDINRLDDFVASGSSRGWYDTANGSSTADLDETDLLDLRRAAHGAIARSRSDDVFVKTHSRMGQLSGVDLTTPSLSAGGIYIVRNPLDVVISSADHFGITIDEMIETMADPDFRTASDPSHAPEYIGDWSTHVNSWTGQPDRRLLVLRYEDLLSAPSREFNRFCTFLGLNPPPERLKRAIQFSSFKVLRSQERQKGFKERAPHSESFFRSGLSNSWRTVLSREQAEWICKTHGRTMQRFGYPASPDSCSHEDQRSMSHA